MTTASHNPPEHAPASPAIAGMPRWATTTSWVLQIVAAVILGQTLFFKFSAAPEPVYIFSTLNAEPWGRLGTAVFELIAVVLLLWPRLAILGAGLSVGLMTGAIGAHLFTPLGIEIKLPGQEVGDGGLLFALGGITMLASLGVLALRLSQIKRFASAPVCYITGKPS